jgi:hypothetical protein
MLFFLQLPFWLRSVWVVLVVLLPLLGAVLVLLAVPVLLAAPALAAALC